jgi:lipoyl(octanoyl) transferase
LKNLSDLRILDLGLKPYEEVWLYQKKLQKQRINNQITDTLILVEHFPVYTLGKNAENNHLLQSRDKSVKVFNVERGGDITFHGPGQLVCYPILDLTHYKKSISWYMRILEQIIIDTLEHYDLVGRRITGLTGVWVGEDKIAAQGVKISRWVTMHGFSLNINPDLLFYDGIIPCGIFHHGVTSVELLLGKKINMEEVKEIIIKNFNNYFYKR